MAKPKKDIENNPPKVVETDQAIETGETVNAASTEKREHKGKKQTVKSPNTAYNGVSMGVSFSNGTGTTNDPWLIQRFKEAGYEVK